MTAPRTRESRPARGGSSDHVDHATTRSVPRRWRARPDLFGSYPEPCANLRPTMFGLALEDYRAEYRRRQAEGWRTWELELRFPRPDVSA